MSTVMPSVKIDTSGLVANIPQLVATGRRTLEQQCVTSLGWIMVNAQGGKSYSTPFVTLGRINAEMDAPVTMDRTGSKGRKQSSTNKMTQGQALVLARMNPNSDYNKSTGNRWLIPRLNIRASDFAKAYGDGDQARRVFWEEINNIEARQRKAKHSSTHFLRHGFAPSIRRAFSSPYFRHSKKYRSADSAMANSMNSANTLNHGALGSFYVRELGDSFSATGENNLGEFGPSEKLNARHRDALLKHAVEPTQAAVNEEEMVGKGELNRRMADALGPIQRALG